MKETIRSKLEAGWVAAECAVETWAWELAAVFPLGLLALGLQPPIWILAVTTLIVLGGFFWWQLLRYPVDRRRVRRKELRLDERRRRPRTSGRR